MTLKNISLKDTTPNAGEIALDESSNLITYDGSSWVHIGTNGIDIKEPRFIETERGQELLEKFFMEWVEENHPEELL